MRATVGDIELAYVPTGPEDGTPIFGTCQPLFFWPSEFTATLSAAGFRALTLDNRDVGPTSNETQPAPNLTSVLGGDPSGVNDTLSDMTADVAGLIEAIGWETANVLGHSMRAAIAQRRAIDHPETVRTLTLFAGGPLDGRPGTLAPEFLEELHPPIPGTSRDGANNDWLTTGRASRQSRPKRELWRRSPERGSCTAPTIPLRTPPQPSPPQFRISPRIRLTRNCSARPRPRRWSRTGRATSPPPTTAAYGWQNPYLGGI